MTSSSSALDKRLLSELKPLADHFLEHICNRGVPITVEPRLEGEAGPAFRRGYEAAFYKGLLKTGTKFYIIRESSLATSPLEIAQNHDINPANAPIDVDLRKAALTYNKCKESVYCMWPALTKMYSDDPEIDRIEWTKSSLRPRIVLFDETDLGRESVYAHEYVKIYAKNGENFVFDPTGYQFGLPGVFFRHEDYEREWRIQNEHETTVDPDTTVEDDEYNKLSQKDNYFDRLIQWKATLGGISKADLKKGRFQ